ncbi:slit homolog 1 protein-like [Chelonus insularis]|uniref:slit homolog 1 protein-like n=1 Tax=Chelonus insularis TaxID=460826 RepID=UPI00158E7397|nr:slit homolog 1 protein-like [Chelonus insularis]XP_034939494.1 slit homolog 1 protein-like [Chelonus insularis]
MMRNNVVIYLTLILGLLLTALPVIEGKCSLAPLDAERRQERILAYVCIHGDLSDLDSVPNEAEWIEFTVARLHSIHADAFSRFSHLRRLTFYNCEIRDISLDAFRGLNDLEWLVLSNTKMTAAKAAMFKHIPNLKMLTLDSVGLIYVEPEVFEILSRRLEILSLRNNDLDCLPIDELRTMKRLKTVRIDENPWLCDCRRALLAFFEKRKIKLDSPESEFNHYNRRKRWHTQYYNETFYNSSSIETSTRVYDCMAVLEYPPLPPAKPLSHKSSSDYSYDYSWQKKIEWREATALSISYLDRLPDEIGWIEIFDMRIQTIRRYTFFRFGNSLRSIMLRNCGIEYIEPEAFAGLHKLQRLTIIGAKLPVVQNHWFTDLTRLTDLILEHDFIERFEYGALDRLRNLRRLDLKSNRLNCLPVEHLEGLTALERVEAGENPWRCICRQHLESYLLKRRVGYQISNSRADGIGCIDDSSIANIHPNVNIEDFYNFTTSGRVRWSWGYEIHAQKPTRPPPTPAPPAVIETRPPPSPVVQNSECRAVSPQHYHHHHRYNNLRGLTYVCSRGSLVDLQEIPSTVETIIFSNSVFHTLKSDVFRKFDGYLKRLEFRNCAIQSIDERAFSGLHNLENLVIRDNDIEVVRSEWFKEIRNLKHLDLARNNIGRIDNGVFDCVPYLVSLDISDNVMNCIGIEHLEKLHYLREFNVAGNPWTCLCATRLEKLIEDRHIYCDRDCLKPILQGDASSSWGGCSSGNIKISQETVKPPSTTPYPDLPDPSRQTNASGTCYSTHEHTHYHCSNGDGFITSNIPSYVRSIEIYDSYLLHLPAASFARFSNLTELILRNCSLRDIDPRAFEGLNRLERLIIQDNRFSVVRNTWFKDCGNLYWLDLSKNNLVEIETGAFDDLKQLQYLNLEDNAFECIYTSCFIHLPRLDTLEFGRNPLKWRCWQELRQFLEVRAIGYTYWKCPHDSKALVRTLQDEKKSGFGGYNAGNQNINNNVFKYIIFAVIMKLIISS